MSAGIGSMPTDTMCVIRRSDRVRGDLAASILDNEGGVKHNDQRHLNECDALGYVRSKIESTIDDGVDILPTHCRGVGEVLWC